MAPVELSIREILAISSDVHEQTRKWRVPVEPADQQSDVESASQQLDVKSQSSVVASVWFNEWEKSY